MATNDIAAQWLKENDPKRKQPKRYPRRKLRRDPTVVRLAHEPQDVIALERLAYAEDHKAPRKKRRRPLWGLAFIKGWTSFNRDECLFYPNVTPGQRAQVKYEGRSMAAAAVMCELVHGPAPEGSNVCRHLCGNGHLSCVNPVHLAWGTPLDNSRDHVLHTGRPMTMPRISRATREAILASTKLPNVLAIEHGLHASVIRALRQQT